MSKCSRCRARTAGTDRAETKPSQFPAPTWDNHHHLPVMGPVFAEHVPCQPSVMDDHVEPLPLPGGHRRHPSGLNEALPAAKSILGSSTTSKLWGREVRTCHASYG